MRRLVLRWPAATASLLILLLVAVVYGSSLGNGPVWDDRPLVTDNPFLQSVEGLGELFRHDLWTASEKREPSSFYRPLTMLTFWINAKVAGSSASAMRAGSIFFHAVNAVLLFFILLRFFLPPRWMLAGMLAILWGVLALNSESVLWVSGRFDLLIALAALACLLANRKSGPWGSVLVVAFASCGLLFKEAFMGWLPLLLLDDLLLQDRKIKSLAPKYVALGFVVLANILLRQWIGIPSVSVISGMGFSTLLQSYLYTFATLLPRAFIPIRLDPFHPYAALGFWESMAWGVGILALTIWFGRKALGKKAEARNKFVAFGWVWFLVALFPASLTGPNLFMIGDRYFYLPGIGLVFMAFGLLEGALEAGKKRWGKKWIEVVGVGLVLLVVGQALALVNRIPDWRDDRSLAEASIRSHPANPYALYTLGMMAVEEWDLDRAEGLLLEAQKGNPRCWRTPNAICVLRIRQNRFSEAKAFCERSIAFHPQNPRGWSNLASVYVNQHQWREAKDAALKSVELKPFYPEARYLAAVSFANLGDFKSAREHLEAGLAEDPTHRELRHLQQQMAGRR